MYLYSTHTLIKMIEAKSLRFYEVLSIYIKKAAVAALVIV